MLMQTGADMARPMHILRVKRTFFLLVNFSLFYVTMRPSLFNKGDTVAQLVCPP